MNGFRDYYTKLNGQYTEKQISYDTAYIWNLKKNDTNEYIYKTGMDSQI